MSERDFKGVWIPKAVWLDSRLTALDKVILTEIDSLDQGERGCFASNKHIAEFCQCGEWKVSTSISKLVEFGYLHIQNFDGRQREIKSRLVNFTSLPCEKPKADLGKSRQSNTSSKPANNPVKKESKKGYDEILSHITDDGLRELYVEYIKMRKFIKSPMTDRALTMLINKVNSLEPDSVDRQKRLLETAIINNWKSVYPIKEDARYGRGRKEPVPGWMEHSLGDAELEAIQRVLSEPDPDLAERADKLRQQLQGG